MEDGIHQVVLNGCTKLDEVKPDRTTWEWDDLENFGTVKIWTYDENLNQIKYKEVNLNE